MDMQKRARELADQWYGRGKYMWAGDDMAEFLLSLAAQPADHPVAYRLAMRVLQSDLYHKLDDAERAECDAQLAAPPQASKNMGGSDAPEATPGHAEAASSPSRPSTQAQDIERAKEAMREIGSGSGFTYVRSQAQDAAQPCIPTDRLEQIIDAYVDDYEFRGDDGDHTPTDSERILIKDAIMGLLVDDDWDAEWGAHIAKLAAERAAPPPVEDEREAFEAWASEAKPYLDLSRLVDDTYPSDQADDLWAGWQVRAALKGAK